MADEVEITTEDADSAAAAPKKSKKKLFIIIGAVLFLLIGGGAGAYFAGVFSPKPAEGEEHAEGDKAAGEHAEGAEEEKVDPKNVVYFTVPDMIVNLQAERSRPVFLKISLQLELAKAEDQPAVEKVMPRIVDSFQIYLRELRVDELRGSAGIYRLREELLTRVNQAVAPVKVRDLLFKDVLVQ